VVPAGTPAAAACADRVSVAERADPAADDTVLAGLVIREFGAAVGAGVVKGMEDTAYGLCGGGTGLYTALAWLGRETISGGNGGDAGRAMRCIRVGEENSTADGGGVDTCGSR
jgi:hypothetical protein